MNAPEKIKAAFLEMKKEQSFDSITITDLCRNAQISRTAFYRYYSGIDDVLNELIKDVLNRSENFGEETAARLNGKMTREKEPICEYLRSHQEYKPVFSDSSLLHLILREIVKHQKAGFISRIKTDESLSDREAEILLYYQAAGCMTAVNRSYGLSDEEWEKIRERIDGSMSAGLKDAFDF